MREHREFGVWGREVEEWLGVGRGRRNGSGIDSCDSSDYQFVNRLVVYGQTTLTGMLKTTIVRVDYISSPLYVFVYLVDFSFCLTALAALDITL